MTHMNRLFGNLFAFTIVGGSLILLSAPSQAISISHAKASRASFVCNYAITIAKQGSRVFVYGSPRSDAKVVSKLVSNAPVYVCDEQGQWYQVRFNGTCKNRFNNGLRVEHARLCPVGWMRKRNVDVQSG